MPELSCFWNIAAVWDVAGTLCEVTRGLVTSP